MRERPELYAEAFYVILMGEGNVNEVKDELFRFSRVIEGSDELRNALIDPHVPVARRQQIVEDILEGKGHDITAALVSLVVAAGRITDLPAIVEHLLKKSASLHGKTVAEVRSAVPITEDQKDRLAKSLQPTYGDVDLVVILDPTVLGGVITQIGDTVIDGSVRHRLAQLRESF
jgi:F-type H+-transporting ATPase subunit delta